MSVPNRFSALQRAEIAEIEWGDGGVLEGTRFSALQRAEIAEISRDRGRRDPTPSRFSALQRAEIAEMPMHSPVWTREIEFQCSSTSRNC